MGNSVRVSIAADGRVGMYGRVASERRMTSMNRTAGSGCTTILAANELKLLISILKVFGISFL